MRYLVIVERTGTGYSSHSPDLPGCIATGRSRSAVEREIRAAIDLHLTGMREEGLAVPTPTSYATYVEVAA